MKRSRDNSTTNDCDDTKHPRLVPQSTLSISALKTKILQGLEKHQVILLKGGTGCGKTTQIPQFIYDDSLETGKRVKVAITQPRRIAAVGAATRVCWERKTELPYPVGYMVALDNNAAQDTAITYMTTGVLVQIAASRVNLAKYSHIIIDEIHERDVDMDIMLSVLRDSLKKNPSQKLILMSATIDLQLLGNYFYKKGILPSTLVVPEGTNGYKIDIQYLNHVLHPDDYTTALNLLQPGSKATYRYDISVATCKKIVQMAQTSITVLVFLPGLENINSFKKLLYNTIVEGNQRIPVEKWIVLPLHSGCSSEEQRQVLLDPPLDKVRVVLATNVAESSITVKGVTVVFDFCLTKTAYTDVDTGLESLYLEWACKSQTQQRAGRTGRVNDGVVYRLVPEELYSSFKDHLQPEILRCNLESVILKCKRLSTGSPESFFCWFIERPKPANVSKAINKLKLIGALSLYAYNPLVGETIISDQDGNLTELGKAMTMLPVSPRLVYLILLGRAFGLVDAAIEVAAALTVRHIYKEGNNDQMTTFFCKLEMSGASESEIYALVNVYKKFMEKFPFGFANEKFNQSRKNWADEHGVYLSSLLNMNRVIETIQAHMIQKGLYSKKHNLQLTPEKNMMYMKIIIAGAFYPNFFQTYSENLPSYQREVFRGAGGHDPFSTVRIDKFPPTSNPEVYARQMADYLSVNGYKPMLDFSSQPKIYAVYDSTVTGTIGNISKGVFHAIRRSKIDKRIPISILSGEQEKQIKEGWEEHLKSVDLTPVPPHLPPPPLHVDYFDLNVITVVSPSEFWGCRKSDFKEIQQLKDKLNMEVPPSLSHFQVIPDEFCLAYVDGFFWRAYIISTSDELGFVTVRLVDQGRVVKVGRDHVRGFSVNQKAAMLHKVIIKVFCCKLSCIEPNPIISPGWSHLAVSYTSWFIFNHFLNYKIMFVENGVIAGELIGINKNGDKQSLNTILKTFQPTPLAVSRTEAFGSDLIIFQRLNWMGKDEKQKRAIETAQQIQPFKYNYVRGPWPKKTRRANATSACSPLRQTLHTFTDAGSFYSVHINSNDVNCVLLDQTPHRSSEKFVVAAGVKANRDNNGVKILLHDTTILPQIDGITSVVPMLFSPTVLLRLSSSGTFISGALCGLGAQSEGLRSIMTDHDMEIAFSHMIDSKDINTINMIRKGICALMCSKPLGFEGIQRSITENLDALLQRQRVKLQKEFPYQMYDWSTKVVGGEAALMGGEFAPHLRHINLVVDNVSPV